MYILMRTIEIAAGADPQRAIEMAHKIGQYVTDKQGMKTKTTVNVGGPLNQIHWVVMTDSLDAGPTRDAERNNDPEWQQIFAKAMEEGLYTAGSARDTILRVIG